MVFSGEVLQLADDQEEVQKPQVEVRRPFFVDLCWLSDEMSEKLKYLQVDELNDGIEPGTQEWLDEDEREWLLGIVSVVHSLRILARAPFLSQLNEKTYPYFTQAYQFNLDIRKYEILKRILGVKNIYEGMGGRESAQYVMQEYLRLLKQREALGSAS